MVVGDLRPSEALIGFEFSLPARLRVEPLWRVDTERFEFLLSVISAAPRGQALKKSEALRKKMGLRNHGQGRILNL